jgi:hypothetical protein
LESPDFLVGVLLDEPLSDDDDEDEDDEDDEDDVEAAGVLAAESLLLAAGVLDELLDRESVR